MADQPQSKFGGVPFTVDPQKTAQSISKFGGTPVDLPANYETSPGFKPSAPQDFFGTLAEDAGQIIPGIARTGKQLVTHPLNTIGGMAKSMYNLPETISDEWTSGAPGRAVAHLAELGAPLAMEGAGAMMRGTAKPLVKSALGLPGKAEAYGATPAKAVLEETSAVRPSRIASQATGRIADLSKELDAKAAAAPGPVNLQPAVDVIAGRRNQAAARNSISTPNELHPMQQQLTEAQPGFTGNRLMGPALSPNAHGLVDPLQPAPIALGMKRQFGDDFTRFNPARPASHDATATANQAYRSMSQEFNRSVPGAEPLNQRIQSLIPARDRATQTEFSAGPGERVLNRVARPTGAMIPALLGLHEGGLPGMLAAITGQEALSAPTVKMLGARGLYNGGKAMGGAAQIAKPLVLAGPKNQQEKR